MTSRYEWDPRKERSNRAKHGVAFALAVRALNDPLAVAIQDRIVDGEGRWQTIGVTPTGKLLVVAHTSEQDSLDDDVIRIISARPATPSERRRYEQERRRYL